MIAFYKILDFPKIPEYIIDNLESHLKDTVIVDDIGYGKNFTKNNNLITACQYTMSYVDYKDLTEWLHINIVESDSRFNILFQTQSSRYNKPSTHIVHTDRYRFTALNYIIDTGGTNVKTSWYQEKNKPIHRESKITGTQTDSGSVEYDDLTLLDNVQFEKNSWCVIQTRVLHDVENITETRKSLSISFSHTDLLKS